MDRACSCLLVYVQDCPKCVPPSWAGCKVCCGAGAVECEPDDMDAYSLHDDGCEAADGEEL